MPDVYQGAEYWDFSMVDPDNRRPVDFNARASSLGPASLPELVKNWRDGRLKQSVTHKLLQFRAEFSELFQSGSYHALFAVDDVEDRVCAYIRSQGDQPVAIAVQLYPSLTMENDSRSQGVLDLPAKGDWRNILDGRVFSGNSIGVADLFYTLPVAVLCICGEK